MASMLHGRVLLALGVVASAARIAKQKRANNTVAGSCSPGGFCSCNGVSTSYDRIRPLNIWSAGDVQTEVQGFVSSSAALCKPHSAYGVAYKAMTWERDTERCGGVMTPPTPLATVLNDALSDLMSRYFVNIAEGNAKGADVDGLWAELLNDAQADNFNSLHYAMASTAIYLTSHMGLALSALPHSTELWKNTGFNSVEERVDAMYSEYKATFDEFNPFLAENINTIGTALWDARLTSSEALNIASKLVWSGGVEAMFESIRTKTFDIAMNVAKQTAVGSHPLTQQYGGMRVMATDKHISGSLIPSKGTALYQLAAHARWWRRWLGDGLGPVWGGMGGLRYSQLEEGSSFHSACMAAAR